MKSINLKIAGLIINVIFNETEWEYWQKQLNKQIKKHYQGFICNKNIKHKDFTIEFREKNINQVIYKSKIKRGFIDFYERKIEKKIITYYSISFWQFQAILRDVIQQLIIDNGGFWLHTSAITTKAGAWLFLGPSGVGKSTIITMLKNTHQVIADDRLLIIKKDNGFYAYQTPFLEKQMWVKKSQEAYRINRIFFLKQARNTNIIPIIDSETILSKSIEQILIDSDSKPQQVHSMLKFISQFKNYYLLEFTKNITEVKKALVELN